MTARQVIGVLLLFSPLIVMVITLLIRDFVIGLAFLIPMFMLFVAWLAVKVIFSEIHDA